MPTHSSHLIIKKCKLEFYLKINNFLWHSFFFSSIFPLSECNIIVGHLILLWWMFWCSALEPSSLHRAVYPVLTSYSTPDKQAYPRHSLSRAALITSGSPIFFLDAFTTLIVFYSSTADPTLPYPPPHDCKSTLVVAASTEPRWFSKLGKNLILPKCLLLQVYCVLQSTN